MRSRTLALGATSRPLWRKRDNGAKYSNSGLCASLWRLDRQQRGYNKLHAKFRVKLKAKHTSILPIPLLCCPYPLSKVPSGNGDATLTLSARINTQLLEWISLRWLQVKLASIAGSLVRAKNEKLIRQTQLVLVWLSVLEAAISTDVPFIYRTKD